MEVHSEPVLKSQLFNQGTPSKRVMLIDDSEDFRSSLKEFLEFEGWMVEDVSNVTEAMKSLNLSGQLPDMILLDYLMPLENGIYFWNLLNDNVNLCHIPTIMITAHDMTSINAIGIRAVVKKPIDTDHLMTIMNTLWNEKVLNLTNHTILN